MITKYVKTSGGDYNTLQAGLDYIAGQLASGMTDHITLNLQGGQVWGTNQAGTNNIANSTNAGKFGGYSITIQTDPADSQPAIMQGYINMTGAMFPGTNNGKVYVKRLITKVIGNTGILKADGYVSQPNSAPYTIFGAENCICFIKSASGRVYAMQPSAANQSSYLNGVTIFASMNSADNFQPFDTATIDPKIYNCSFNVYSPQATNALLDTPFNCSFYNYSGTGTWDKTGVNNSLTGNPNFNSAVIQSQTDTPDTMYARGFTLTSGSTTLLNNDYSSQRLTTDIYLISRPQGVAGDRGAIQYVPTASRPTLTPFIRARNFFMMQEG